MKTFIASHRAGLGLAAMVAWPFYYAVPDETGNAWGDVALSVIAVGMLGVVLLGGWALYSSPYMRVLFREAPLQRAMTGATQLDERELLLRDRAAGLTYNLFAAFNMTVLFVAAIVLDIGNFAIDGDALGDVLIRAVIPYAFFSSTLPVLMLEWFEPSSWLAGGDLEDDEA
jgi:hypothetical protein